MSTASKLVYKLFNSNAVLFEPFTGSQTLLWGLILFFPDAKYAGRLFKTMFYFASPVLWGSFFVLLGSSILIAWWKNNSKYRQSLALSSCIIFSALSYLILLAPIPVIGIVTIPLTAIFNGLVYVRLVGLIKSFESSNV